ncbi:cobyrinate a,c-diamide synthase [Paucibacter sp. R3-3]|uniref:Cobyrinate a,c-diamide synthase n=1 Tax=Roseateles agri TaxID=3098619 RepID=A0ABU5DGZ8_9BURK|nr:cobyrinate a,c-diamide synthase [Paucibacter sp. R3-3]MDY0745565.1 cobyrinate a,c-diamide synthase [Paucibacter sp. R3-3]
MAARALMISAPASGQGKTSVTAAIARSARRRGERVRVFKTGPDFLDPMVLERASGRPVYQLDLFMVGLEGCRALLAEAAAEADLILVEGVMGLFDGAPSSADLAAAFGLPVLVVIDGSAMAQTLAAVATGLQRFRDDIAVRAVVANRIAGAAHARMVAEALPATLPLLAALPRAEALRLPARHLGLVQAMELPGIDALLDGWADAWDAATSETGVGLDSLDLARIEPAPVESPGATPLAGRRVAVARDACFSFIYPANLDCLRRLGAELLTFSPLAGEPLPPCDALWLPGGYPELHAQALASNESFFAALVAHLEAGRPLLAECGGMLALLDSLTDLEGRTHRMAGLIPGEGRMQTRLAALGLQQIDWPEGPLRGHSFHHSTMQTPLQPVARATHPSGGSTAEALYTHGSLRASYVHHYFPSNPAAIAAFLGSNSAGQAGQVL